MAYQLGDTQSLSATTSAVHSTALGRVSAVRIATTARVHVAIGVDAVATVAGGAMVVKEQPETFLAESGERVSVITASGSATVTVTELVSGD